jgi:hypothetical protein
MIFAVAVFDLILVSLRSSEWDFHNNIFFAVLLLLSSILLLLNSTWSNLIAAILSGYLPITVVWEFWRLARNAEVPVLSSRHFSCFFLNIQIDSTVVLFLALTLVTLARAVFAVKRSRV